MIKPAKPKSIPSPIMGAIVLASCFWLKGDPVASGNSQCTYTGTVSALVSVSSTSGIMNDPGTGARVTSSAAEGSEDTTELIDFGELAGGNGQPVSVMVNFTIRGNASYKLNVSNNEFAAANLQVKEKDIAQTGDQGSFIKLKAGSPSGSGIRANPQGTRITSLFENGTTLDRISQGQVSASSTSISTGDAPSLGGTLTSNDNAVVVPLSISVPSGFQIGPSSGEARGMFQVTLQVAIFPEM
jgi:hypothetical protein